MTKFIAAILILASSACANSKCVVNTRGDYNRGRSGILDLRLERVAFSEVTMQEALLCLADGISSSTDGKINFSFGVENSGDLMDRTPKKDPKVRLEVTNSSLASVLDKLCRQARWSYRITPVGIMFVDQPPNTKGDRGR